MNKPTILYYTDSNYFAGCENMLAEFFNDENLNKHFVLKLIYRYSILYDQGLTSRIQDDRSSFIPLNLPDPARGHLFIKRYLANRLIRRIIGLPIIWFWKYYCVFASIKPIYKQLKQLNTDILHINNGGYPAAPSCYSMIIAARLCKIRKIVYVVNNTAEGYKNPLRWLDFFLDQYVKKTVCYFITGSRYSMSRLQAALNIGHDKLMSIANGIERRKITKTENEIRKQYDILPDQPIFLTGAVFEKRKGHIYLLEAINNVIGEMNIPTPVFIFAGDGEERNVIETFIANHGLGRNVILTGAVSNIFDFINAADVVVLPSISHEDFPFIIIEAMSLGKPVIGTLIAGMPEQIVDNTTGYIIPAANSDMLLHTIKNLLDRNKREQFGNEALRRFNNNYTATISVGKYKELYDKLLFK